MCILINTTCLLTQASVISGKPFVFVNFGVADQMYFWDTNLTWILNLQSLVMAPDPAKGLTCPRNSPVGMGPFQSERCCVVEQASPDLSVFLGNGPKVLHIVTAEDARRWLPCCLTVFNRMIAEGSHFSSAFHKCWALWLSWWRNQIWKSQILPRLKLMLAWC